MTSALPSPPGHETLRTDALIRPLSRAQAQALIADLPTGFEKPEVRIRDLSWGARIVASVLTVANWGALVLLAIGLTIAASGLLTDLIDRPWSTGPIVALVVTVLLVIAVVALNESRRAPLRRARLVELAHENDWDFEPVAHPPSGALFAFGTERTVHDRIRLRRSPRIEVAEYSCRIDSGKSTTVVRYAYIAIALPQKLPHIALDAIARGSKRSPLDLSAQFADDQRLSLEGDFDQHFRLFCPSGYEQDALYLFTPDIMALFIDHAGAFDVEIIDGWLLLYGLPKTVTEPTVQRWTATLELIDALDRKLDQWDRWRDASKKRHAPRGVPRALARPRPNVAAAGERLRPARVRDRVRRASVVLGAMIAIVGVTFAVLMTWLGFFS